MGFANKVLMVRPGSFFANPETADSNEFQVGLSGVSDSEVRNRILGEFDGFVGLLREAGIEVVVLQDAAEPAKPDAIFPNNVFSTNPRREWIWYPMLSPLRRLERRTLVVQKGYVESDSFLRHESEGRFLEGTGSLVLAQEQKLAFAALSPRTDEALVQEWCTTYGYRPMIFDAVGPSGMPIYHTNVVMGVGPGFVGIGLDCILEVSERARFRREIEDTGLQILEFSPDQIAKFAGNFLTLQNAVGEAVIVMSKSGWESLESHQQTFLQGKGKMVIPDLATVEALGGGSARCCLAELF